jgi:CoA-binding protein
MLFGRTLPALLATVVAFTAPMPAWTAGLSLGSVRGFRAVEVGVPVLGTIDEVGSVSRSRKIDEVIIAIPSANRRTMRRIVQCCQDGGLKMKKRLQALLAELESPGVR